MHNSLQFAVCAASLIVSVTSLTTCPEYPIRNFTQKLDHSSNTSTATFQQQYQLNTKWFKPGGPILFFQGAENGAFECVEYHYFEDIAAELGAITCALGHRFFDTSFPSDVDPAKTPTKAKYASVTMDNVVADSAAFVQWVKSNVTGAKDSKVIVNGGSYGGTLSTMDRLMYPDVFYAAWSSAPLLQSLSGSYDTDEDKYNWWDSLANTYQDTSVAASNKISEGLYKLVTCGEPDADCKDLLSGLQLCDSGPQNATEWETLYTGVLNAYWFASQFSYYPTNVFPVPYPLNYIINETLKVNDTGSVLHIAGTLKVGQTNLSECFDWRNPNLTSTAGAVGIGTETWSYIQCAYLPALTDSIRNGSMFPPQNTKGPAKICADPSWEGPLYNKTNDEIIKYYGWTAENIQNVGRILITQQGFDPTTAVGPPPLQISGLRNASRTITMPSIAHTEDTFSQLIQPRGVNAFHDLLQSDILQQIIDWVEET